MKKKNIEIANGKQSPTTSFEGDYGESFPKSKKIFIQGDRGVSVPMREITLSGGEPSIQVADTSGPLGIDPQLGLPKLREDWILNRTGIEETSITYRDPDPDNALEVPEPLLNKPVTEWTCNTTSLCKKG